VNRAVQPTEVMSGLLNSPSAPAVAIDLFCGAGGMSLGFEAAGFDILVAVDNNPIHVATHEWNFPKAHPLCADLLNMSAENLLAIAKNQWVERYPNHSWTGEIDCVFGGPSCQGFSEIGRRNPVDERNELLSSFAKLVAAIKPKYFVMENVPGLLWPANGALLRQTLKIFTDAGYLLTNDGPFILNAGDFGVPQARRRVFVMGSRSDMLPTLVPAKEVSSKTTVAEALNDLRSLERYRSLLAVDTVQLPSTTLDRLESEGNSYVNQLRTGADSQHGSYGLGYERPWDRTIMTSCGRTVHRPDVVERFRQTPQGVEELVSRLPRLRSNGLAPTLRAGTGRDHGSFTSARPIHHIYPRVITVREAARLHSFPDWFRFHETKWHGFQQIGNSVPPFLARAVAHSIASALDIHPEKQLLSAGISDNALLRFSLLQAALFYNIDPDTLPKDSRTRAAKDAKRKLCTGFDS
jgi:DNA (cytosine-5)-methyltransferase 1